MKFVIQMITISLYIASQSIQKSYIEVNDKHPRSFLTNVIFDTMLPVSLDCPFLIAPLIFSDVYLAPVISMGTC